MRGFGMMRYAFQFWAFLIVWCGGVWALQPDVTLTSKQGGMVIRGTVLDYDGRYISLDSDAGPVVFDTPPCLIAKANTAPPRDPRRKTSP